MQQSLKLEYQTKELVKDFVIESCNSIKPWLINVRRELHKIPELALKKTYQAKSHFIFKRNRN